MLESDIGLLVVAFWPGWVSNVLFDFVFERWGNLVNLSLGSALEEK